MKRADGWEEIIETWAECPHCFKNVKLSGCDHRKEDDVVECPECGEQFILGESA